MVRMIVTALAVAALCACSSTKGQEADGGGGEQAPDASPRSCTLTSGCEAGEYCSYELERCSGSLRTLFRSGTCVRPACGAACQLMACSSDDDCQFDQACSTAQCESACCFRQWVCAMIPTCPADCAVVWPPHRTCWACVCPSCEAPDAGLPLVDGGEPPGPDAGVEDGPDAGGSALPDGGVPQACLTSSDCAQGEHCDVVLDKCASSSEAVLVSSKCTKPACGSACLGRSCADSEECAEGQQCAMGLPGGPSCTSPCCQNGGRCTMEPNCRSGCTAVWPPHETCFVCVCPSCGTPADAG